MLGWQIELEASGQPLTWPCDPRLCALPRGSPATTDPFLHLLSHGSPQGPNKPSHKHRPETDEMGLPGLPPS